MNGAFTADVAECYQLGVNCFISKPVGFDDFAKAVAALGVLLAAGEPRAFDGEEIMNQAVLEKVLRVPILEDSPTNAELAEREPRKAGIDITWISNVAVCCAPRMTAPSKSTARIIGK
jgi:hypothetical protein